MIKEKNRPGKSIIVFPLLAHLSDYTIGHNAYQRFYYNKGLVKIEYPGFRNPPFVDSIKIPKSMPAGFLFSKLFFSVALLLFILGHRRSIDLIITDRTVISFAGLAAKLIGIRWSVDLWDSPYKEYYKASGVKRWLLYVKSWSVCRAISFADSVIVSFNPDYAKRIVKNERMHFYFNAIDPSLAQRLGIDAPKTFDLSAKEFTFVYVGVDLEEYGFTRTLDRLLNSAPPIFEETHISIHHFGPVRNSTRSTYSSFKNIIFHGQVEPEQLWEFLRREQCICLFPLNNFGDIGFTYPVKILDYYCSNNIIVYNTTTGFEQFLAKFPAEGIFSFDEFTRIVVGKSGGSKIKIGRRLHDEMNAAFKNSDIEKIWVGEHKLQVKGI